MTFLGASVKDHLVSVAHPTCRSPEGEALGDHHCTEWHVPKKNSFILPDTFFRTRGNRIEQPRSRDVH